jgi:hypothetical protein
MTEKEWQTCREEWSWLLCHVDEYGGVRRSKGGRRKLRLFGCACVRRVWRLLRDPRSRRAVEVAELYVDGLASSAELRDAEREAKAVSVEAERQAKNARTTKDPAAARSSAAWAAWCVALPSVWSAGCSAPSGAEIAVWFTKRGEQRKAHCALLRDIFGNPFRPAPVIDPRWLAWNDGAVLRLARSLYDGGKFTRLGELADLLRKAGCKDAQLLRHLRSPGPHVRGCWALDALLGKEGVAWAVPARSRVAPAPPDAAAQDSRAETTSRRRAASTAR